MPVQWPAGSSGPARFLRRDQAQHLPLRLADQDMERAGCGSPSSAASIARLAVAACAALMT
jgi:hypothetical protein